jgi:hypothetical protein
MPCIVDPTPEELAEDHQRMANKLLGPLLCSACRTLERMEYDFDENPALSKWWSDHKKADEAREREEAKNRVRRELAKQIAQLPVNTLTSDEKAILRAEGYL